MDVLTQEGIRPDGAVSVLTADLPFRTMLKKMMTMTGGSLLQISSVKLDDQFAMDATIRSLQPLPYRSHKP